MRMKCIEFWPNYTLHMAILNENNHEAPPLSGFLVVHV